MESVKLLCEAAKWLDQPLPSIQTRRFGWLKKRAMLSRSTLRGEDVRQGPSVPWFSIGNSGPTIVGSVKGIIYKVATTIAPLQANPDGFVSKIASEISDRLQTEGSTAAMGVTIWQGTDGNAVLQEMPGGFLPEITVFVTSNIVRPFLLNSAATPDISSP